MIRKVATLILFFVPLALKAQDDIIGKWKTIDDETGKAKSVVNIYEKEGKYYGKIVKLYRAPGEDPDPVCNECPENDPRHNKKVIGMEIIKDLKKEGVEYVNGTVLKPDEGKIYNCKIWLDGEQLKIRGYWGFFYRTQTWVKAE